MDIQQPYGVIVADFTADPLAEMLRDDEYLPQVESTVVGLGQVARALHDLRAERWGRRPDFALVWTRPEAAIPSFKRLLGYERVPIDTILAEVDSFTDLLLEVAAHIEHVFVPTWTLPYYQRGLGLLSLRADHGQGYALMRINLRLAERLSAASNVHPLDTARWLAATGKRGSNPKLWPLAKLAFGPEVLREAGIDLKAGLRALAGQSKKLIILDLDDTLWGGIVGDLGWENLRLGGHDPTGEAFVEFQLALKDLTRAGVALGIVSKNDEAYALEAIESHPEMVLRRADFAGWRINWEDKAGNIAALANDLGLGLDAIVFIDDSPAERGRIREALPAVTVPEWPDDKLLFASTLRESVWFDRGALTDEDVRRSSMYAAERERGASRSTAQSFDEWLESLGLVVKVGVLDATTLQRATQLLNKTNQMNLTTRRLSESEFLRWAQSEKHRVFVFSVADRFGEYGLTGITSVEQKGPDAKVVDFVLSCRVMGRRVEQAMLHVVASRARAMGATILEARHLPTARNKPCRTFLEEESGLTAARESDCFVWDLALPYPLPKHVALGESALTLPATSQKLGASIHQEPTAPPLKT